MKVCFKEFQFDIESGILSSQNKIVQINEKSAKLLTLFLTQPTTIHSKDDILQLLWPDRVVTEQVIFQNISILRGLFGNDAIRTFSKKGYQWQLAVTELKDDLPNETANILNATNNNKVVEAPLSSPRLKYATLGVVILLLTAVSAFFINQNDSQTQHRFFRIDKISANLIPIKHQTSAFNAQKLFDSPFKTWREHQLEDSQLLLSYKTSKIANQSTNQVVIQFQIQGAERGWQGYIAENSAPEAIKALQRFLTIVKNNEYFASKSNKAAVAQLTLLNDAHPDNVLIQLQLAKTHYLSERFSLALAIIEDAMGEPIHPLYRGLFSLTKAGIATKEANREQERAHLNQALTIFSQLGHAQLESTTLVSAAYNSLRFEDYQQTTEYLTLAANKAREAKAPLWEMRAHLVQAYIASKQHEYRLMQVQINQAKQLISLHNLDNEHHVAILNYQAEAANSHEQRLTYYQQVLEQPYSQLYEEYFYYASEAVRDEYLAKMQLDKALSTLQTWQSQAFQLLTKAKIAFANEQQKRAVNYALEAFAQAQIEQEVYQSLDAALLLVTYGSQTNSPLNAQEYIAFINQNMTKRWRRINSALIKKLGYWR